MKGKMKLCKQKEKLQMLSLVPNSLSNTKNVYEFQVSMTVIVKTKLLKSNHRILFHS